MLLERRSASLVVAIALATSVLAFAPPPARADVITSLTTHASLDGPAVTSIASCEFFVKGVGLLSATGVIRIYAPQGTGLTVEVASAPFAAPWSESGLFDVEVGPIRVSESFSGLFAVTDYGDPEIWPLTSAAFDVNCPRVESAPEPCVVSAFRPPLFTPGHDRGGPGQRFKFGQTIPVKLAIACDGGGPYESPTLHVAPAGALHEEAPASTRAWPGDGNLFRGVGERWIYNLDTTPLSKGLWRLRAEVGDAEDHVAWIDLR